MAVSFLFKGHSRDSIKSNVNGYNIPELMCLLNIQKEDVRNPDQVWTIDR